MIHSSILKINLLIFLSGLHVSLHAQEKVWVFFKDKKDVEFDPYTYFDQKAIDRRIREGFPIDHEGDYPIQIKYYDEIKSMCDSVGYCSRWLNAMTCYADELQQLEISSLPFVKEIRPVGIYTLTLTEFETNWDSDPELVRQAQTKILGREELHANGFRGKGVRIAVFDAGFGNFEVAGPLQHLKDSNRVVATYDFVRNKKFVFDFSSHGTEVLTCIAGLNEGRYYGCATESEFLLARTERSRSGTNTDEDHWIASLEWADQWGADIVNSSLGYTIQLYFRHQMDGEHSLISRAASMAIQRGILVVNSAGNEGSSKWELISSPADGDSVLAVGAIDPWTGYHSDFSSYGPTFDLRMKPNVVAFGYAAVEFNSIQSLSSGTSFAAPLITGFAACLRQMHPEWTCGKLLEEIQNSGHLYPYFDYAHGFGIPQGRKFLDTYSAPLNCPECFQLSAEKIDKVEEPKWKIRFEVDTICLGYSSSSFDKSEGAQKNFSELTPMFYFQLCQKDGFVIEYFVAYLDDKRKLLNVPVIEFEDRIIRIWYNGHYKEIALAELISNAD